jgi:hypothetical protein
MVNGKSAEVLAAVGLPGTADEYQVNFLVPADTAKGVAMIPDHDAWIVGAPVSITIARVGPLKHLCVSENFSDTKGPTRTEKFNYRAGPSCWPSPAEKWLA